MKKTLCTRMAVALVAAALLLGGCGRRPAKDEIRQPPAGKKTQVTVQFRRDYLGGGNANLPISPTTDNLNGAQLSLSGRLVLVNAEWVVVESDGKEYWIPRDNILLLRIN